MQEEVTIVTNRPSLADFGLTLRQCRLLLALESTNSVVRLADILKRDPSVISRQLKQIASVAPVVLKRDRSWELTPLGRKITSWTRDAILDQKRILQGTREIRVAAPRDFAVRTLGPIVNGLVQLEQKVELTLLVSEKGVEQQLLSGEADFGFDYGRPADPAVRYRSVVKHALIAVASPGFLQERGVTQIDQLIQHPFLHLTKLSKFRSWPPPFVPGNLFGRFNDEGVAREAAVLGLGWAILPEISVAKELGEGKLVRVPGWEGSEPFGVWWTTGRDALRPWIDWAGNWLASLEQK